LPEFSEFKRKHMPTFNGWDIVPVPATPSAPATVEFVADDVIAMSVSPFTGQQQVQDWQASMLAASVSMPALTHPQAQEWIAFLMALRGQANVFQFGDPLAVAPRGSGAGTPLVDGAAQKGYTLALKGWTAGAAGVLLPGDWIQIGYRLYRAIATANADGAGKLVLKIWPQLRESPGDGAAVILTNTRGLFRLQQNARKWSITASRTYGIQFEIVEAL
jgi:hypothetical protein